MPIYSLGEKKPQLPENDLYWVAPDAHVIGNVILGKDVGVWFGSVLRGDNDVIKIGEETNIQENTITCLKKISIIIDNNKGAFIIGINFLLVYLSTKKPDDISVMIDVAE